MNWPWILFPSSHYFLTFLASNNSLHCKRGARGSLPPASRTFHSRLPTPPPPPTLFWLSDVAWLPYISPSSPSFLSRLPYPSHPRVFPRYTSLLLLKTDIEQWLDLLQVSLRKAAKYKAESRALDQNTSIQDENARTCFVLVKILNCIQCFLLW